MIHLLKARTLKGSILLCLLFFMVEFGHAQKKAKIEFQADNIEYDEALGKKAKRLIGNVVFKHKGAIMHCDSAYQYPVSNSLDAFGSVHIIQGDSLNLYCDSLHYEEESQLFTCRNNVVLDNGNIHLTTDFLIYNRLEGLGYYLNGGTIENKKDSSILTSRKGFYYTTSDDLFFKRDVVYRHPDFKIEADTLKYNPNVDVTNFLGPTDIHADSSLIHCEKGYFNSVTKISEYYKNAYIISESRIIKGDSIYYDANIHYGKIKGHAEIIDTAENISVLGEVAYLYDDKDSAVITEHAELRQYFEDDTLFLHADTFKVYESVQAKVKELTAYHHVRFFKADLQGKCDSMVYSFSDSAIKLYTAPVLWTGSNQITGTFIRLNMQGGQMETMFIDNNAFVNSAVDSIRYNQIRGKEMTGFFVDNKMHLIKVVGNGQTIYYAQDEEDKFIGVNRGESSDLNIHLVKNEISQIAYINDANATFFPMDELSTSELRLKGFSWQIKLRPKDKKDIFRITD